MSFDVEGHLRAVDRSVLSLERDGRPACSITLARSFSTTGEDLWDAVTNGDRIPRWFLPITGDLEPGGRYQLEGNAGGVITACEQRSHFAVTWEFAGDTSWVEVHCKENHAAGSRLELTHSFLWSPHWDQYGPGSAGVGWELGLLRLALHLEQPNEPQPDEAAFATSPEGKRLIAGGSEAWREAAIAAGMDADAANSAANRTTAFYTGA
ncbi:MAG: SRPBCC domain-containing protein [Acidobacteriota bacterium]|nr:SRPBCC domain-containing protein [Acidobacteriota bacterium]